MDVSMRNDIGSLGLDYERHLKFGVLEEDIVRVHSKARVTVI